MNLDEVEADMKFRHNMATSKSVIYSAVNGRQIMISKIAKDGNSFHPKGTWVIWTAERSYANKALEALDPLMAQCLIYDFFQRNGPCAGIEQSRLAGRDAALQLHCKGLAHSEVPPPCRNQQEAQGVQARLP